MLAFQTSDFWCFPGSCRVQEASAGLQQSFRPELVPLRLHGAELWPKNHLKWQVNGWECWFTSVSWITQSTILVWSGCLGVPCKEKQTIKIQVRILWGSSIDVLRGLPYSVSVHCDKLTTELREQIKRIYLSDCSQSHFGKILRFSSPPPVSEWSDLGGGSECLAFQTHTQNYFELDCVFSSHP